MRTPQEIFHQILYGYKYYDSCRRFMCTSLELACEDGVITVEERDMCINEIEKFIGGKMRTLSDYVAKKVFLLHGADWLKETERFEIYNHCRTIYDNWDNRGEYVIPNKYRN